MCNTNSDVRDGETLAGLGWGGVAEILRLGTSAARLWSLGCPPFHPVLLPISCLGTTSNVAAPVCSAPLLNGHIGTFLSFVSPLVDASTWIRYRFATFCIVMGVLKTFHIFVQWIFTLHNFLPPSTTLFLLAG